MLDIVQGTEEWYRARCGKVTASRVADVIAQNRAKTGWGQSRSTYMGELIAERLSDEPADLYSNATMQRGLDIEPAARNAYAFFNDAPVTEVGFVEHPNIPMAGASPDGLVADNGLVQFKCPNTSTHIDTVLKKKITSRYVTQMQWELACTKRQWCDFVSFDPRLPTDLQMFVQRVPRDDERISELEVMVREFLAELDEKIAELRRAA